MFFLYSCGCISVDKIQKPEYYSRGKYVVELSFDEVRYLYRLLEDTQEEKYKDLHNRIRDIYGEIQQ